MQLKEFYGSRPRYPVHQPLRQGPGIPKAGCNQAPTKHPSSQRPLEAHRLFCSSKGPSASIFSAPTSPTRLRNGWLMGPRVSFEPSRGPHEGPSPLQGGLWWMQGGSLGTLGLGGRGRCPRVCVGFRSSVAGSRLNAPSCHAPAFPSAGVLRPRRDLDPAVRNPSSPGRGCFGTGTVPVLGLLGLLPGSSFVHR